MLTQTKLVIGVVALALLSGCAQTIYESSIYDKDGKVIGTKKLKASSLLVNRELGKITLGDDSLEGAKSDQTSAIEALSAIANKAK